MAATKKPLAQSSISAGAGVSLYTTPTGITTILKEITVCNPSNVDVLFTLGIRNGVASAADNLFSKAYISAGQTSIISLSSVVPVNYTVYAVATAVTTGGSLNILATGVEISGSTAKQLAVGLLGVSGSTPVYTVPVAKTGNLNQALFTNTSSSDVTVTMYIAPSPQSQGIANMVLKAIPVAVGETLIYSASTSLLTGTKIYAFCSADGAVNLTIDGTEK